MSYIKYTIYFHLMNDIKIIETDDDGNEYYVNKYVRKGKLVYYPCYRPPVKGFSACLGLAPSNSNMKMKKML